MATLTYNYAQSMAVLGPLSPEHDPGDYDLCLQHARHLQVPAGWQLQRENIPARPQTDAPTWLAGLADEVRRIGWGDDPRPGAGSKQDTVVEVARRGHLRVIADIAAPNPVV